MTAFDITPEWLLASAESKFATAGMYEALAVSADTDGRSKQACADRAHAAERRAEARGLQLRALLLAMNTPVAA